MRDDDPARHELFVLAPGSLEEVMRRADEWVGRHGGRVQERTTSALHARLGSRLSFRLWGARTERLPMAVGLELQPDGPTRCFVAAQFHSDEGWYLVRTSAMFRIYAKKFDGLAEDLKANLTGTAPRT